MPHTQPPDFLMQDPAKIHSWLYWATSTVVCRLLLVFAGGLTLLAAVHLVAVNPGLPFNRGWNTIDHIADPIPLHDFASDGAAAMARSGPWLALATPRHGLVLFSARARVPVSSFGGSVIDVTGGPREGSFYSLESDQGIALTERLGWSFRRSVWSPAPAVPFWQAARPFSASDILFTELNESGLLVAARGAGLARNRYFVTGGVWQRTRDWQESDKLSSTDLDTIVGTAKGYWLTLGTGGIRFADRDTLNEVPERTADTPPVHQLSASKNGDWAAAVDARGSAWFYGENKTWSGPWFDPAAPGGLESASSVVAARLSGTFLFLGTAGGLFSYDTTRRQVRSIFTGSAVESLETVGDGALAATTSGLYFAAPGQASRQLDDVRPRNLHLSPSGDTAVYWGDDKKSGKPLVRAIVNPVSGGTPTVVKIEGWHSAAAPTLRGVQQLGTSVLVATTSGCFSYTAASATYQDCSVAVSHHPSEHRFPIHSFNWVAQEDGALLASADGRSLLFRGDNTWTVVDPATETDTRRLTAVAGKVYGLGTRGEVVRFGANGQPDLKLGGAASSLGTGSGPFRGDLAGDSSSWRLLIVAPSRLLEYRSDSGHWSEIPTPFEPREAVFFGEGMAVVTPWGSLRTKPGANDIFGIGALPFAPALASALTKGRDRSILVGGPSGRITRYSFNSASWQDLPSLPPQAGAVVQLEEMADGYWARGSAGDVFRLVDGHWMAEAAVKRWALSPGGALWTLTRSQVDVTRGPEPGRAGPFSQGDGARPFVARARYVWQPDPDRVVLVAGGDIGVFDRRDDSWREIRGTSAAPSRLLPVKPGLLMLEAGKLRLLSRDLEAKPVNTGSAAPVWDAAAGAGGNDLLWVLEPGKAVELQFADANRLIPTGKQVAVPSSVRSLTEAARSKSDILLAPSPQAGAASLTYRELTLDWRLDPAGNVAVSWRNRPDLPVWGSSGGRLAVQCVHDLWLDPGKSEVVLATEVGILRRSAGDYALRSVTPGFHANLDRLRPAPAAASGGLKWRLGSGGVSVSAGPTTYAWTPSGTGWRLDSDIVLRIRPTGATSMTLETRTGAWSWDIVKGRTNSVGRPAPAKITIHTRALNASLNGHEIRLTAFDGRPALEDGRFFFDAVSDLRGFDGGLYLLVAGGRAVVRRNGSAPGQISGAWRLPPSASGGPWSFARGVNGIRLSGPAGLYELAENQQGAAWKPAPTLTERASTGSFTWRRAAAGGWEVLYSGSGRSHTVDPWWSHGRFSWDDYQAVGAMDGHRLALATPAGIVVRPVIGGLESLLPSPSFTSSATARQGAQIIGTLFDGAWLLRLDKQGQPKITPASAELDQSASVFFDSVDHPVFDQIYAFHEEWHPSSERLSALSSRVPAIPAQALLHAGRFVFDAPSAAAIAPDSRWLTVTGCGSPAGCLAATFAESGEALFLIAISALSAPIETLSTASNGQLFGLAQGPRTFRIDATRIVEVPVNQTGDAFDAGHAIELHVDALVLNAKSVKIWDSTPRLKPDVPGYPLLTVDSKGVAFSFDVLNTLAMNPQSGDLVIGTEGGVFSCPGEARGLSVAELARACRFSYRSFHGNQTEFLQGVSRIRFDHDRVLWARFGQAETVSRRAGTRWVHDDSGGPFTSITVAGVDLRFLSKEVRIGETSFSGSNDAWWIGRRPFSDIVDSFYDDSDGTLWLCDQSSGLFALKLVRLTSPQN